MAISISALVNTKMKSPNRDKKSLKIIKTLTNGAEITVLDKVGKSKINRMIEKN